jgi:polysaccharide biosynthesis transport protein
MIDNTREFRRDIPLEADGGPLWYYMDTLLRRRFTVIIVAFLVMCVTVLYVYAIQPVYQSHATIEILGIKKESDKLTGEQIADPAGVDYLATQIEILKSQALAQSVIEKYDLSGSPEFAERKPGPAQQWLNRLTGLLPEPLDKTKISDTKQIPAVGSERAAGIMQSRIKVKQVRRSNILEVSLEGFDPLHTKELLGKFVAVYIDRNLEKRRSESLEAIHWLNDELEKQSNKLRSSETALLEFTVENNIVSKRDGGLGHVLSVVDRSLDSLNRSRETRIKAEAASDIGSKRQGDGMGAQQGQDQYTQSLRQQLATLEADHLRMSGVYSPDYPTLSALRKRIDLLKTRIDELEKDALAARVESSANEESRLRELADGARREAQRMNALEAQYARLKRAVDTDREFYDLIHKQIKSLDVRVGTISNNVTLVDAPSAAVKVRPKTKQVMAVGFALSLLLGIGAAFVIERSDRKVRSVRDLDEVLKLPKLGVVPDAGGFPRIAGEPLMRGAIEFAAFDYPASPISDAIRSVQTSITLVKAREDVRSLMITSASPGEGKTYLAVSISSILQCGNGKRTIIVDADLRRPKIYKVFGNQGTGPGLSNLLSGKRIPLAQVIRRHRIPGLFYMTSGPVPRDPVGVLQSRKMLELIALLSKHFDHVVFDCPPVLGFPDTTIMAQYVDGVILVAREGVVTRSELRDAYATLASSSEDKIIGVILNGVSHRGVGYGYGGGYYYKRNYKYYHKERVPERNSGPGSQSGILSTIRRVGH